MERLLVTGIDTVLGSNLATALADRCEVLGLYERYALECPAVRTAAWHREDPVSLAGHFHQWQPQWVIHCGPLSSSSWDLLPNLDQAAREAPAAARLAELASQCGSTLMIMSSDAVFTGPRLFHEENSPATNPSPWATMVRDMERAVEHSDALVIRTHAYGWSFDAAAADCFAHRACEALLLGRTIAADGQSHATPILATDLAEILWRTHEMRLRGLYHIAGAERSSSYRFVSQLAASLGIDAPVAWESDPARTETPDACEETSLSSKRARRLLATATPMLREGLDRFVAQQQNGRHQAWHFLGEVSRLHEVAA